MKYTIEEKDILIMAPVSIKKLAEDYLIIKKEDLTTLTTRKAGAKVVELIASGKTLFKIKEIISKEFNVDKSTVNITPILESLIDNGFISRIGGRVMFRETPRPFVHLKHFLTIILSSKLLEYFMKRDRVQLIYPILKRIFFNKVQIDNALIDRAKVVFMGSGFYDEKFSQKYANAQKQIAFDKTLFFNLNDKAMGEWIKKYFVIENKVYFDTIKDKTIIFCGYHFSNFEMLPIVLGNYGLEVCTPIAYKDDYFEQHVLRTKAIKDRVFPAVPQIYSRSEKDGLILFRALKNNRSILLFCDTHILLTEAYVTVRFLGRMIKVNRGAALLHKKTHVPIVPVLTYQKGNRCYIKFLSQILYEEDTAEQDITQKLFGRLEDHMGGYPHQWAKWHDLELMTVSSLDITKYTSL
jgi:Bacterial lipid A biosynthesis acyltransferase